MVVPYSGTYEYALPKRLDWEREYYHHDWGYNAQRYFTRFQYKVVAHRDAIEVLRWVLNWGAQEYEEQDSLVFHGADGWYAAKRAFRNYHGQFDVGEAHKRYKQEDDDREGLHGQERDTTSGAGRKRT